MKSRGKTAARHAGQASGFRVEIEGAEKGDEIEAIVRRTAGRRRRKRRGCGRSRKSESGFSEESKAVKDLIEAPVGEFGDQINTGIPVS